MFTFPTSKKLLHRLKFRYKIMSGVLVVVLILSGGFIFWPTKRVQATVETFTASSTSWQAPAGVYSVSVELWGGGGTGGAAQGNSGSRAGGGAGGQYAIKQVAVTPGNSYTIAVGQASTATNSGVVNGNDTTFATTTVVAKGGAGGATATGTSSSGGTGSTTGGVGDTVYAGGSGGNGTVGGDSGGGGSGAGSTGTGNSGTAGTAGTTKTENGGAGGTGVSSDNTSNAGSTYGGGGSGGLATGNPNRAGGNGAAGFARLTYTVATTTLADTTDPSNATLAPGASATMAGAFTFQTSNSTDVITAAVVGLGTGAATGISLVEVTSNDGATVYGSTANPGSDTPTVTLSTNTLTATTSLTTYKIRITPKTHANMAVPGGATYTVTAKINSWTSSNSQSGTDTAGTTLTIDNSSPSSVTSASGSAGDQQVTLGWTTSASSDFSRSVVLRWTSASVGSEVPVEGTDYSVGDTISTATVACVRTGDAASTVVSSQVDGGGGSCSASALSNGTAYSYKVFQKDSNGNYDTGVSTSMENMVPANNGDPTVDTIIQGGFIFQGGVTIQ